jgi:hypothetical protein
VWRMGPPRFQARATAARGSGRHRGSSSVSALTKELPDAPAWRKKKDYGPAAHGPEFGSLGYGISIPYPGYEIAVAYI